MLSITPTLTIPENEIELTAIRAQGAGGQNVNKVNSAVHLRFDVMASSLPDELKERLLRQRDQRLTTTGVLVIKAQQFRTWEKNRADALERLAEFIAKANIRPTPRRATRPSRSARQKRMDNKTRRGSIKRNRGPVKL